MEAQPSYVYPLDIVGICLSFCASVLDLARRRKGAVESGAWI